MRYRIDGMLYDVMTLPEKLEEEVIARVKVLSNMDVTERRHPQDGHCSIEIGEKTYDMRAATLPTVLGEKLVLRMLSADEVFLGLGELGLEPEQLQAVEAAVARPYGMILVTGPIAAGKTSTLYAALSEIDIFTRNVVTIEDPVEYRLPGINQVEIDHRVDRTFANMLRAVLRQDANVMMVGEIRDEDTAAVAVRAAMTGHMVFSTLHANDAVGAIGALRHLGIPPYLVTSAVHTVAAQRLVPQGLPALPRTLHARRIAPARGRPRPAGSPPHDLLQGRRLQGMLSHRLPRPHRHFRDPLDGRNDQEHGPLRREPRRDGEGGAGKGDDESDASRRQEGARGRSHARGSCCASRRSDGLHAKAR